MKLSQASLREQLLYLPEKGEFWWIAARKGRDLTRQAGTINNFGYRVIMLNGHRYVASRLAWLYMTGNLPAQEIDHINRNQSDDRWINLREVSRSENACNTATRIDNASGYRGVCWDKQKLKWKVQVSVKGGKRIQKHFEDINSAVDFYKSKAEELFGEFEAEGIREPSGMV